MEENTGINNDLEVIKKQREDADKEAAYLSICIKDVMVRQTGRHFIWTLLENYQVFHDGFHENPVVLARNAGIRSSGLLLLKLILEECPDQYEMMFAEHKYKEKEQEGNKYNKEDQSY